MSNNAAWVQLKNVQRCVGLVDDRCLIPAAVAASLGADLSPELDAGVHILRNHHRRRRHLITSRATPTFVQPENVRRQVNTLPPPNTSSAVHRPQRHVTNTYRTKPHEYYGHTALLDRRFLACVVSSPNDNQRNSQVQACQDLVRERSHRDQIRSCFILA
jgi:hypothetical protein